MRVLSLDIGYKNIGVAISSFDRKFCFAVGTVRVLSWNATEVFEKIKHLIIDKWGEIDEVLLGDPHNSDYTNTVPLLCCEDIKNTLNNQTNWTITSYDENFSSVESKQILKSLDFKKQKIKTHLDAAAAVVILSRYLGNSIICM